MVTCPDCGVALAPFLNPDGSVPPGPHTCPHMIFVIVEGGPSPGAVDDARPLVIDRVPALGRNHANRPIAESTVSASFGALAPILAVYRHLWTAPPRLDLIEAIAAMLRLEPEIVVIRPHDDASDVGIAVFAGRPERTGPTIRTALRALDDGFRELARRTTRK